MRSLFVILLLPALALAAPALKPVVALLPVQGTSPELTRLGLLIEARASELLESTGRYREVHVKQVLAMAQQEGLVVAKLSDDDVADRARVLLGADRVISVRLAVKGGGLLLQGSVRDGATPIPFSLELSKGWSKAVREGSEAIAKAVLGQDQAALTEGVSAQPESTSDVALKGLATCWEIALVQSMSVEAPVTVSSKELRTALSACRAASKADPTLSFARAVLAMLLVIDREDDEAEKILEELQATAGALEPLTMARFWRLTRSQPNEIGEAFLEKMIQRQPGALLLRAYLAQALASSNQSAKAVAAWNAYLTLAPNSAYAYGKLSRSLAKLEQLDAALKAANQGLTLAPGSREARLQLAGRQIDAKDPVGAVTTLAPFVDLPDAPAEGLLRLGWAHWLLNDVASAKPLFALASERAKDPKAWRTKGRALYDLALVELKAGDLEAARALYRRSVDTGFVMQTPDPSLVVPEKGAAPPRPPGGVYVFVDKVEDKGGLISPAQLALTLKLARENASGRGAALAPEGEDSQVAIAVLKAQQRRGFQVTLVLAPGRGEQSLKVDALLMTYPEKAFRGVWTVNASGAAPAALINVLVPTVINDVAVDLEW